MILPLAAVYMIDRGLATAAFEHSSLRWNDASIEMSPLVASRHIWVTSSYHNLTWSK